MVQAIKYTTKKHPSNKGFVLQPDTAGSEFKDASFYLYNFKEHEDGIYYEVVQITGEAVPFDNKLKVYIASCVADIIRRREEAIANGRATANRETGTTTGSKG